MIPKYWYTMRDPAQLLPKSTSIVSLATETLAIADRIIGIPGYSPHALALPEIYTPAQPGNLMNLNESIPGFSKPKESGACYENLQPPKSSSPRLSSDYLVIAFYQWCE